MFTKYIYSVEFRIVKLYQLLYYCHTVPSLLHPEAHVRVCECKILTEEAFLVYFELSS